MKQALATQLKQPQAAEKTAPFFLLYTLCLLCVYDLMSWPPVRLWRIRGILHSLHQFQPQSTPSAALALIDSSTAAFMGSSTETFMNSSAPAACTDSFSFLQRLDDSDVLALRSRFLSTFLLSDLYCWNFLIATLNPWGFGFKSWSFSKQRVHHTFWVFLLRRMWPPVPSPPFKSPSHPSQTGILAPLHSLLQQYFFDMIACG